MASLGGSGLDSNTIDSCAGYSACPRTWAQEHGTKLGNKITFRTASGERHENFGSRSVPHWNPLSDGTVGRLPGGHRCVWTSCIMLFCERCRVHRGAQSRRLLDRAQDANTRKCQHWHCLQIPHRLARRAPEPVNHWRHMQCSCRSDVQMRSAHRWKQKGDRWQQNESIEQAHAASPSAISDMMGDGQAEVRANARPVPPRLTKEEMENHNFTHVVIRNRCRCCVAMRTQEQQHHLV